MKNILKFFGRLLLVPISWIPFSRLYGRIMRLRRPHWLALSMIRRFQKSYQIDMEEFQGRPEDYGSLSEFFLPPLATQNRPLKTDEDYILSPADGRLSELELVAADQATQVKGWTYPLSLLLAENIDFAKGWHVATIYLSPKNYHRFHYPLSGRITGAFRGGTRLFPVNGFSVHRVKSLYIRNERLVTRFAFRGHSIYMVAVGATFVGAIGMKYLPAGLPAPGRWLSLDLPLTQMAEMGHFAMGSTIILVVPAALVDKVVSEKGKPVR
ncbi:MAG TPA: archaetidylserine decarboxylase, partial [Candidatus Binatia bacterium]|nr:archaetidylserine decarboxylase [Candidatus Binatia bacterium]